MKLVAICSALLVTSSVVLASESEIGEHCPLTGGYLVAKLDQIAALPPSPTSEELAPLQEHALRMSGEVLKNEVFSNQEACEYFFILVNLKGLDPDVPRHRERFQDELNTLVKRCKKWIEREFPQPTNEIQSLYCG